MSSANRKPLSTLLRAKKRSLGNYFRRRLDRITRIELALFLAAVVVYLLALVNNKLGWLLESGGEDRAWEFFHLLTKTVFLMVFLAGYFRGRRQLRRPGNALLFMHPLSPSVIRYAKIVDMLYPILAASPMWLAVIVMFIVKTGLSGGHALTTLVVGAGLYLLSVLTGVSAAIVFAERAGSPGRGPRYLFTVLALIAVGFMALHTDTLFANLWMFLGLAGVVSALLHFVAHTSLNAQLEHDPESFFILARSKRDYFGNRFLSYFTLPIPCGVKAIARKDLLFALRKYRVYWILFAFLLAVCLAGLLEIADPGHASSWLSFSILFASFVFANLAFKFNEEDAERLEIIRSNPVPASKYWWAKFWVGFLPVCWLILLGHAAYLAVFGPRLSFMLQSILFSLFFSFSLIFYQNNFSLYSYPYARYAPLWFYLFIIVAVAFFTVLLFPLLTVAFVILGYLAIFRVLHRIENVEIV